jgi:hypothetical protein
VPIDYAGIGEAEGFVYPGGPLFDKILENNDGKFAVLNVY